MGQAADHLQQLGQVTLALMLLTKEGRDGCPVRLFGVDFEGKDTDEFKGFSIQYLAAVAVSLGVFLNQLPCLLQLGVRGKFHIPGNGGIAGEGENWYHILFLQRH